MIVPLIGLIVGIIVGMTSTGGGALLTPALVIGLGVPPSVAIATDMLVAAGMKSVGGFLYAARHEVHWPTVARLAVGSIPGALLGVVLVNTMPAGDLDAILRSGLGYVLILAGAAAIVLQVWRKRAMPRRLPSIVETALLGFSVGMLVSMTSVGSGSVLLCALTFLFPFSSATMVGTDLAHALILTSVSAAGHLTAGRVDLGLAGALLVGAIPGVVLGARLASAMPERALRAALAVLLVGVGLHLVWPASVAPASAAAPAQP